jgi:hypothetical protein
LASLFINCRDAHALLSERCDGALGWRRHLALRVHLLGCSACGIVSRNLALVSRAMQRFDQRADGK